MSDNLDTLRKRAELPNALHGCTSNPCGSVVCQTARDRDELLSRLEQAERNADTYQTLYEQRAESLEQAEQAVQRVREMSAHRKEIRLDYVGLIDLDRALDGDGRLPADDALGGDNNG